MSDLPPREPPAEHPLPYRLVAEVLWRRLDTPSFEICRIMEVADFVALHGTVLTTHDGAPLQVAYIVQCDRAWVTRAVHVQITRGRETRRLELRHHPDGTWTDGDRPLPEFDGLHDIDLSVTPATNTLPIRRLGIAVGASARTDAVWVRFPDLSLERLAQTYTRRSDREYVYESRGGEFRAPLEVDAEGVVVRYGDIWKRIAPERTG